MLWSLLRVASRSQRTLYQNSFLRLQNSRFSWSLSSRYVYNSSRIFQFGLQQRTIFSRCFKHLNKASNTLYRAKLRLITFDSSLVHYETRRFVGTRAGYKSSLAFNTRNSTTAIYVIALVLTVVGLSYLAVPLYRLFCQATGLGGTVKREEAGEKIEQMERIPERELLIRFNADKSGAMRWNFRPQQTAVKVAPGETALAFYTATNPTDEPITGVSTYNVVPFEAGQYFNKIQCFCFEEQRLNPHEQVDMPVFFYIDPEFTEDPAMAKVDTITLSYTFFEAKEAEKLGL